MFTFILPSAGQLVFHGGGLVRLSFHTIVALNVQTSCALFWSNLKTAATTMFQLEFLLDIFL